MYHDTIFNELWIYYEFYHRIATNYDWSFTKFIKSITNYDRNPNNTDGKTIDCFCTESVVFFEVFVTAVCNTDNS